MKAADITDQEVYDLLSRGQKHLSAIQTFFHATREIPPKVTLAKLRQMFYKGRLIGCICGCSGDFVIPPDAESMRLLKKRRLMMKRIMNSL